jgi:hypothetical protein
MTIYNHSPSDTWTLKTTGIIPEFATGVGRVFCRGDNHRFLFLGGWRNMANKINIPIFFGKGKTTTEEK